MQVGVKNDKQSLLSFPATPRGVHARAAFKTKRVRARTKLRHLGRGRRHGFVIEGDRATLIVRDLPATECARRELKTNRSRGSIRSRREWTRDVCTITFARSTSAGNCAAAAGPATRIGRPTATGRAAARSAAARSAAAAHDRAAYASVAVAVAITVSTVTAGRTLPPAGPLALSAAAVLRPATSIAVA